MALRSSATMSFDRRTRLLRAMLPIRAAAPARSQVSRAPRIDFFKRLPRRHRARIVLSATPRAPPPSMRHDAAGILGNDQPKPADTAAIAACCASAPATATQTSNCYSRCPASLRPAPPGKPCATSRASILRERNFPKVNAPDPPKWSTTSSVSSGNSPARIFFSSLAIFLARQLAR